MKADFLIKFGAFVEWPAGAFATPDTPLEVCVVGHDPFGAALDRLAQGRSAGARAMVVRRMPAIAPGTGCRIAWLGGSPEQSVADAASQLAKAPVLTVTDGPSPASGVIHMVTQADRVRFEVDLAAAARAGLTISSKLLNLAVAVRR